MSILSSFNKFISIFLTNFIKIYVCKDIIYIINLLIVI